MENTPATAYNQTPVLEVSEPNPSGSKSSVLYLLFVVLVIAGALTGYFLAVRKHSVSASSDVSQTVSGSDVINTKNEVGSKDTRTFRDHALGTLEAGGMNGEGTHKLVRDGGPSQTVYLVSSVVDLDEYVGKKVEIWGETLKAKLVGWLMDVGRLKILD